MGSSYKNITRQIDQTDFQIQIFFLISLSVMVEIVELALKAVIDYFEFYTINSLIKKIWDQFHYV